MIKLIVCHDLSNGIGYNGDLLFNRLKDDMDNFKKLTTNNIIVMGRKTWDSLPFKLPKRMNIVISRNVVSCKTNSTKPDYVANTIDDALQYATEQAELLSKDIFIIGGATLYNHFVYNHFDMIDEMIITKVYEERNADTFFPKIDHTGFVLHNSLSFEKTFSNEENFCIEYWVNHKHV